MGTHLASSRTSSDKFNPVVIRYSLAKRIAIAEDIAAGIGWDETAVRHGVSKSTVHGAVHSPEVQEILDPRIVNLRRKNLGAVFESIADMALSHVDHAKLGKMNAYQLVVIAAMAVDKARLLQGLSTENLSVRGVVEHISSDLLELRKKRQTLMRKIDVFQGFSESPASPGSAKNEGGNGLPQREEVNVAEVVDPQGEAVRENIA